MDVRRRAQPSTAKALARLAEAQAACELPCNRMERGVATYLAMLGKQLAAAGK